MKRLLATMAILFSSGVHAADVLQERREHVQDLIEAGAPLEELRSAVLERHAAEDAAITAGAGIQGQLDAAQETYLAELRASRFGVSAAWGIPTPKHMSFTSQARLRAEKLATEAWTTALSGKDRTTRTQRATAAGIRGTAMLETVRDNAVNDDWVGQLSESKHLLTEARELAQGPRGLIILSLAIVAAAENDLDSANRLLKQARAFPEGLDTFTLDLIENSITSGGIKGSHRIAGARAIRNRPLTPGQRIFLIEWLLRASMESGAARENTIAHATSLLQRAPSEERRMLIRLVAELVQRIPGPPTAQPLDRFGRARRAILAGDIENARLDFQTVGTSDTMYLQPEAWFELAQMELLNQEDSAAADALIKGVASEPSHPSSQQAARLAIRIAQRNGAEASATKELLEVLPNHPDRYQWRVNLAREAFAQYRLQDALALWQDIPTIASESVEARHLAAEAILESSPASRLHSGNALRAVEALEDALETHPDKRMSLITVTLRIHALLDIDRRREAARLAETLHDLDGVPADLRPRVVAKALDAFNAVNRTEDASRLLATYARIDPEGNARFSRHLLKKGAARIRLLIAEDDPERARLEALRLVANAIIPDPNTIQLKIELDPWQAVQAALILRISGRPRDALRLLEVATHSHPDASEVIMERAEALFAIGEPDSCQEAIELYKRMRRGVERGSPAWWICELRQLEILDRLETNLQVIGPRIDRLRLLDPDLGGTATERSFHALQARVDLRALKDAGK